ncbi:MAG: putative toxin-antitoxin system toxin component, PIN family [Mariprofundus sp.]|nr:putative toxin-antitoxin system toxin component, PIN family [Mariprofundus sp.]
MLPKSIPGNIISAWKNSSFELVLSEPMLVEIVRVLAYPKIRKRIGWSDEAIDQFIVLLRFRAELVDIKNIHAVVPRDPDDAPVLAAFIASDADYLVSGDQDLLELQNDYAIETAADFAQRL